MDEKLVAAMAGAGATLLAVLLKDIVVPLFVSFRQKRKEELDAMEKYAEPLAIATYSLFFRLQEILESKRAIFLRADSSPSKFHTYKYRSSLYRLASIIGWIWALKKEKSLLLDKDRANERSVYRSIAKLESAFADGPHVELAMLSQLSEIWRIPKTSDIKVLEHAAAQIDSILDNHLYDPQTGLELDIKLVPKAKQISICSDIAKHISSAFSAAAPPPQLINGRIADAIQILSPRQAWIFRDWQGAIGQVMMRETGSQLRMFDIIGFSEFDDLLDEKNKWIAELDGMLRDLRPEMNDPNDYRIEQLWSIYEAISHILITLKKIGLKKQFISDELYKDAMRVIATRDALSSGSKG